MIRHLSQNSAWRRMVRPIAIGQRYLSTQVSHTSFPATLLHYCPRQRVRLYDHAESDDRPDDLVDESAIVEKNGLVYREPPTSHVSNGAVLYPNTFMMQEFIRMYYDEMLDREDEGKEVETPYIFTIRRGTPIPSHLILINEYMSRFSLRPAQALPLQDLNQALNEFFDKHAKKETASGWLDNHPFQNAVADDALAVWGSH
ncbi:uncharacterized protein E0L32_000280 [Thyridium curvatum]|uniref:Tse2 ADP-ribosyltransferase toxin domain-containing protein n=1 Tax=Thyridium curvatum TaxID=1093900 RepID=A0A507B9T7_9PEZI|nr:uncharacterized protein E0L32_000280 [Thyridium curvatum]TPX15946.1 hypothetical protein E0L32_000280 [Thyridium curvatum]